MAGKLKSKVAMVTGSGRGIGRATALKLAREGADVVVNDLDEAVALAVVNEIRALGVRAVAVPGSVTEEGFAERFVGAAISDLGGLDIIVNNAGYTWDSTIGKTTDAQFQAMLDVHVLAPFRILRAASTPIRDMTKREAETGGVVHRKVVNISSIAGLFGNVGQVGYSSAKAAITGMTRTMAREWGRYNVNVNAVAFGLIETRMTQVIEKEPATINISGNEIKVGVHPDLMKSWQRMIPLGRAGTPEDAANAVYLLCTPESDYISGQIVVCAGGLLM